MFCLGHLNGFVHLDIDLNGLENKFDLGYKFEQKESDTSIGIDSNTGVKLWTDPVLVLYISVKLINDPIGFSFLYSLERCYWQDIRNSNENDKQNLLKACFTDIKVTINKLNQGVYPLNINFKHIKCIRF